MPARRWRAAGSGRGLATPLILPGRRVPPVARRVPARVRGNRPGARPRLRPRSLRRRGDPRADLRRACEMQIKSHLLHLREGYVEAGGHTRAVAELVRSAAPAFAALLRNVARLHGVSSTERMDLTRRGAQAAGVPETVVEAVLALEHRPTAGVGGRRPALPQLPRRHRAAGRIGRPVARLTRLRPRSLARASARQALLRRSRSSR